MKLDQRKFQEVLVQSEEEYDDFLKKQIETLNHQKSEEQQKSEALRASIIAKTKENNIEKDKIDQLEGNIKDLFHQIQNFRKEQIEQEDKYKNRLEELSEKEYQINIREQKIKSYRSKNVHLQNFRQVYDYRVQRLKEEQVDLQL